MSLRVHHLKFQISRFSERACSQEAPKGKSRELLAKRNVQSEEVLVTRLGEKQYEYLIALIGGIQSTD